MLIFFSLSCWLELFFESLFGTRASFLIGVTYKFHRSLAGLEKHIIKIEENPS